jgi:galactose mutarotase-like enzyme
MLEGKLAAAEENVVIRAGDCTLHMMPALGGKIASLRVGENELLQAPLNPLGPRTHSMGFSESDASGWDECLPSVAACTLATEAGAATIPDHGDLWRVPWQVLEANEDSATFRAKCFSLPLQLTRSMILTSTGQNNADPEWSLQLLYSLTNLGGYRVPWSWSAHPLFAVEAGDRVTLPDGVRTLRLESAGRLGERGDSIAWPLAASGGKKGSGQIDLSVVVENGAGDKLFAGPLKTGEGWCSVERVRLGLRLTFRFETAFTPYLGLWLCYGGWPDGDGPKQFCVAPEPATAPVDSLAETGEWSRWLEPGETTNWPMELTISKLRNATGEEPA